MKDKDYPNLYQAANIASVNYQKWYLQLMRADLLSAILGASLAIYNFQRADYLMWVYVLSAFLFFITLICSIILFISKYEDGWYQGRAMAESCKTLTWRYIMQGEFFERHSDCYDIELIQPRFMKRIEEIEEEYADFVKKLDTRLLRLPYFTNEMERIRTWELKERVDYYIKYRIEDQIDWYSKKERYNNRKYISWFIIIGITQLLTLFFAVYLIVNPLSQWNFVGLFSTISASAMSWLQLKQHQGLKQAYTTAVMELNKIKTLSTEIKDNAAFAKFVLDSENAISREHTLWIVQRRK